MSTGPDIPQVIGVRAARAKNPRAPRLAVNWESRRRNFFENAAAVLGNSHPPNGSPARPYFRDSWVEWPLPKRALFASALCHIAVSVLPFSLLQGVGRRSEDSPRLALPRIEVTWYGPVRDLPPLSPATPTGKSEPYAREDKSSRQRSADAFHARQTIVSAPAKPTHPRQTLIQPDSVPAPPKILPQLPDIVQWGDVSRPSPRHLEINRAVLARLRPRRRPISPADEPLPQIPNLERQAGDLSIASSAMTTPRPLLPVAPASVSQAVARPLAQEVAAAPEVRPEVNTGLSVDETGLRRLVAVSASPAPPPAAGVGDVVVPAGNLTARFSLSPDGSRTGLAAPSTNGANGIANHAIGSGPPDLSISEGDARMASSLSSAGAGVGPPSGRARPGGMGAGFAPPRSLLAKPRAEGMDPGPGSYRTQPLAGLDAAKTGTAPEEIFGPKRVYTLHVNMPNLASITGSWILSFVELPPGDAPANAQTPPPGDLNGPVPVRKVDPKYPPVLVKARVEGEVVLYAIIRRDGSVDSIQLVKGIDPQLDSNAMEALSRWKFRPARRQGGPVELEAIVRIPFRAIAPTY